MIPISHQRKKLIPIWHRSPFFRRLIVYFSETILIKISITVACRPTLVLGQWVDLYVLRYELPMTINRLSWPSTPSGTLVLTSCQFLIPESINYIKYEIFLYVRRRQYHFLPLSSVCYDTLYTDYWLGNKTLSITNS